MFLGIVVKEKPPKFGVGVPHNEGFKVMFLNRCSYTTLQM